MSSWVSDNFLILNVFVLALALRIRRNGVKESIPEESIAIDALARLIELIINYAKKYKQPLNDGILAEAVKTLEKIGTSSPTVINAVLRVIDAQKGKVINIIGIDALGKVGVGNPLAISNLVKIFRTKYDLRREVIESLKKALQENLVAGVTELRWDLMNWRRCGPSSDLMWYCAQNISYPEFYQAWHTPRQLSFTQRIVRLIIWGMLAVLLIG